MADLQHRTEQPPTMPAYPKLLARQICRHLLLFALALGHAAYAETYQVAIASAHPLASEAGLEIIRNGGNVFDAAVAVSAALAVVEPAGSGLGGGGYWLLHRADDGFETVIDGREKAPQAAHKDIYLDQDGQVIPRLSLDGPRAAAIPGLPAALAHLAQHYGRLPLKTSLAPAIRHAVNGFAIGDRHLKMLGFRAQTLKQYPQTAAIFLPDGDLPAAFSVLKQPDLAHTLTRLAESGRDGFYRGDIADKLVTGVTQAGGIWSLQDLADYQIVERKPLTGHYRGITVTSVPPSSSGGVVLLESLNILSGYDLKQSDATTRIHLIAEALRRAYHDRAWYLGDGDFIDIPVARLLSADYAAGLRTSIRPDKALPSHYLSGDLPLEPEGDHTTHFSIIDQHGNRVAATLSINFPFGSGFVADGTGVLLNDEMDDFSSKAGHMNGYGLTGAAANAIAPGKRPLSSMTPTFLADGQRIAALGTPGGSRIPSMVLLGVLAFADGLPPAAWVSQPRFHHQYLPDALQHEADAFTDAQQQALAKLGHQLKAARYPYGDMQAVALDSKTRTLTAASDPRGEGRAVVGP